MRCAKGKGNSTWLYDLIGLFIYLAWHIIGRGVKFVIYSLGLTSEGARLVVSPVSRL